MGIKERKQITGTEAQIKGYAGHNGVLAYATDTEHLHVLSGTAGTTTKLANMSDIPAPVNISGKADKTYVDTELAKRAPVSHTHTTAQVTDLDTALADKAPMSHTHTIDNVTGLQVDLTTIRESITNVSSKVDGIGDITSALDNIQAQLGQLESRRYVKETGRSSSGSYWYRVWSDGWIEQGGTYKFTYSNTNNYHITLSKRMTTTTYHASVTGGYHTTSSTSFGYCYDKTTSGFTAVVVEPGGTWCVCGY